MSYVFGVTTRLGLHKITGRYSIYQTSDIIKVGIEEDRPQVDPIMPAPAMRVGAMALLLGAAAAFSPAYLPHLTRVHAASNTCLAKMISVPPLRGESLAATNLGRGSQRKASLVPINQMPAFTNKWADPNYDPTKEEIATKVPLQIAAFKGDVEQVHFPRTGAYHSRSRVLGPGSPCCLEFSCTAVAWQVCVL